MNRTELLISEEAKMTEYCVFTEKEDHSQSDCLSQARAKDEHLLNKALVGLLVHNQAEPLPDGERTQRSSSRIVESYKL